MVTGDRYVLKRVVKFRLLGQRANRWAAAPRPPSDVSLAGDMERRAGRQHDHQRDKVAECHAEALPAAHARRWKACVSTTIPMENALLVKR